MRNPSLQRAPDGLRKNAPPILRCLCMPSFFQGHGDDVQCVHPLRYPVGHGVINQPMPGDVLQSFESGVDHPDSKMTSTTRGTGVADVQMALVLNLDCGLGKGLSKAFQQCIARGFHEISFMKNRC